MAQVWRIPTDSNGEQTGPGAYVDDGLDANGMPTNLPQASGNGRLIDPKWASDNEWGNYDTSGGTSYKWRSPSGAKGQMVMTPNGPMFQLPEDAIMGYQTTDSSANMGALGQIGSLFSGPIGIAAGAALGPMLFGGNGALAGGNLNAFDFPSLTAAEAATYGAPSLSGYTGAAGAAGAAGGGLAADLAGATGGAANPAYTYDPGGAANPFGPMEGGGNLGEYNFNPGGELTPFGPTQSGGNIGAGAAETGAKAAGGLSSLLRSAGILGADTANDGLIDAAGRLAPGLLGAFAASSQGDRSTELANTLMGYGQPYRDRLNASMTPGFDPTSIPGYQGAVDNSMNTMLRKLSTQGNPFGNPGGLIEANKSVVAETALPALQEYQRLNLGAGGLGNLNAAAPAAMSAANSSGTNVWNSLGYGVDQAINGGKQKSLADYLKGYVLP